MSSSPDSPFTAPPSPGPSSKPSTKPIRFKNKRPRSRSTPPTSYKPHSASPPVESHPAPHIPRRHRHHHHRSRRRLHTPPSAPHQEPHLSPDAAFRASLFDALADDEGAEFWEGVYGQPIHTYSTYNPNPEGELERMDEEEYVAHVRHKMWEKSHGYVVEERRRREAERKRKREKGEQRKKWEEGVEEALRRGEERKRVGRWKNIWEKYVGSWDSRAGGVGECGGIVWPVESGRRVDVEKEEVEKFFRLGPLAYRDKGEAEANLGEVLKRERVRWHPDKMQQRAGMEGLNGETMKSVTAVFQVIDRLWSELKGKS